MICSEKGSVKYAEMSIPAALKKFEAKKRTMLNIKREQKMLSELIHDPPTQAESFRMLSAGGFSSIAFIRFVAEKETISDLYVSSLTIGKKHANNLDALHSSGKLMNAFFVFCSIFEQSNTSKYNYFTDFSKICEKNGWKYAKAKNHSKIILMRTDKNWYIVETSSNMNENPKIEQFTFENDETLFKFYLEFFDAMRDGEGADKI